MKKIILTALLCVVAAPAAYALDLASARASGAVCEKGDGYIVAKSAEASSLAASVNAGRKAEYARISKQNGQPVDVVAKVAAQQIIGQGNKPCQ